MIPLENNKNYKNILILENHYNYENHIIKMQNREHH